VKNAPQVSKMFEDKVPETLIQEFPELKNVKLNLSNGLIGISKQHNNFYNLKFFIHYLTLFYLSLSALFKAHIVPNYEKAAGFLQGFRLSYKHTLKILTNFHLKPKAIHTLPHSFIQNIPSWQTQKKTCGLTENNTSSKV
jgi:hypothetical protein